MNISHLTRDELNALRLLNEQGSVYALTAPLYSTLRALVQSGYVTVLKKAWSSWFVLTERGQQAWKSYAMTELAAVERREAKRQPLVETEAAPMGGGADPQPAQQRLDKLHEASKALTTRILAPDLVIVAADHPNVAKNVVLVERSKRTFNACCTCPWAREGAGTVCTHVLAAVDALAGQRGLQLRFYTHQPDTACYVVRVNSAVVWTAITTFKQQSKKAN